MTEWRCWHTFISTDTVCWQWKLKSTVYASLKTQKKNTFWLHAMFCLWWCLDTITDITMSSFGSCLGSDSGIPLKKHGCLFRQKQGIPVKSAWHHCTRTQFNKLHKHAVDVSHWWDSSWKIGFVRLITPPNCYSFLGLSRSHTDMQ